MVSTAKPAKSIPSEKGQLPYFNVKGLSGEKPLAGEVEVFGAKNAALKAMAASMLFADRLELHNVPDIEDVRRMAELLRATGAIVSKTAPHAYLIDVAAATNTELDKAIAERMRSSVVLSGPTLARFGKVQFPHPGGCVIGERPIDLFLEGFRALGAEVTEKENYFEVSGALTGGEFFFRNVSVTGTETLMMAATLAKGRTVLKNAAMEPEIEHLAAYLNFSGAKIRGAGTQTIEIEGGELLRSGGVPYVALPDRIEAGSFLILGSLTAKELVIKNCQPEHFEVLTHTLLRAGVPIEVGKREVRIRGNDAKNSSFTGVNIRTHEYPGFPTDLQAPMTVFLTQASGEAKVFESIFENRLNYTKDLADMGADITFENPHQVAVRGPRALTGRELAGPDLRAGLAFIIAALVAKGDSVINNVYYIDRGYEAIERRLMAIGAPVERVK